MQSVCRWGRGSPRLCHGNHAKTTFSSRPTSSRYEAHSGRFPSPQAQSCQPWCRRDQTKPRCGGGGRHPLRPNDQSPDRGRVLGSRLPSRPGPSRVPFRFRGWTARFTVRVAVDSGLLLPGEPIKSGNAVAFWDGTGSIRTPGLRWASGSEWTFRELSQRQVRG